MEGEKQVESKKIEIGRNEPCPCGSDKKYKRCCGVDAAPKLGAPKAMPWTQATGSNPDAAQAQGPGGLPFDPSQLDQEWMGKFSQAMQRLPRGQMQRLQSLMQRAMAGKDVRRDAEEFERTLPPELKNLMGSFQMPGIAPQADSSGEMSEEEARRIVAQASAEGKISSDEAQELLATDGRSKLSKLWGKVTGKK